MSSNPAVIRSPYAQPGHERLIELCQAAAADLPSLDCLAYYDRNLHAFTVDRTGDQAALKGYETAFRQLVGDVRRFDDLLRDLGTGDLMRTVVETAEGAVYCGHVFAEEFLVGATRRPAGADSMDEGVGDLVTRIRQTVYQQADQLPGGDREHRAGPLDQASPARTIAAATLDAELAEPLTGLLRTAVNTGDLHYVALHLDWSFAFSADVFDQPALAHWFKGETAPEGRRKQYLDVAARLRADLPELAYSLRLFSEQPVRRIVFDVVAGALYVYPLAPRRGFVLGLTLNQPEVYAAEQRLRPVVRQIEELLRPEHLDR